MENHDKLERIDMILGEYCNNNCVFCNMTSKKDRFYDKEKIFSVLDDAAKKQCKKVNLLGGEPSIHPNFIEIIEYAKLKKFETIGVVTNGRMFSYGDFTKNAISAGLKSFTLAFYSHDKKTYDSITQISNSFEQAIKGIKNILKFKNLVSLSSNVVINFLNYNQLNETSKFIINLGIERIHFSINDLRGNNSKKYDTYLPLNIQTEKLVELFQLFEKKAKNKKSLNFSIDGLPICAAENLFMYMEEYNNKDVCEEIPQMNNEQAKYGDFIIDRKSNLKNKYSFCKSCSKNSICEGVWNGYFDREETKSFLYSQFQKNNFLIE